MNMRNKLVGIVAFVIVGFMQCNPDDIVPGFEMSYNRDFEIFAGLNTFDTHVFRLPNFDAAYDLYLNNNGVTDADVKQIVPKFFRITNLTGNITFEDLWRVRLFMVKTDGTLEREIAFLEPIPNNIGYQINLVPTLADSKIILESGEFDLLLKLNYRTIPAQSIDARMSIVFQAVTE